ncbi:hypothetical protein RRG08_027688 [Elysia crispata]|uniref:Uncharacterized protein n=1 Tax=Elysia crispata TaxID=231223 RepID=A0AAE0XM63_9GAST|nr:hypothetical protein RRG08_027688 [Elysia crispata]
MSAPSGGLYTLEILIKGNNHPGPINVSGNNSSLTTLHNPRRPPFLPPSLANNRRFPEPHLFSSSSSKKLLVPPHNPRNNCFFSFALFLLPLKSHQEINNRPHAILYRPMEGKKVSSSELIKRDCGYHYESNAVKKKKRRQRPGLSWLVALLPFSEESAISTQPTMPLIEHLSALFETL